MISEIRSGSALALLRFRVTRTEVFSAVRAGLFLGCWTVVGLTLVAALYPEFLAAESGVRGVLRSSLAAFGLGCLLLPLQLQSTQPSRWDGLRAWIILLMIGAAGIFAGRIASPYSMLVAAWLLAGALPASIWLSGQRP